MKCYTHADVDAAGICRSCGKGVCRTCARDIGIGIVCSDACEALSRTHHEMMERAAKMYRIGNAKQKIPMISMFLAMFGGLFAMLAVFDWMSDDRPWVGGAMSLLFAAFAVMAYFRAKGIGLNV